MAQGSFTQLWSAHFVEKGKENVHHLYYRSRCWIFAWPMVGSNLEQLDEDKQAGMHAHIKERMHSVPHASRVAPQHMLAEGNEAAQQHKHEDDQWLPLTLQLKREAEVKLLSCIMSCILQFLTAIELDVHLFPHHVFVQSCVCVATGPIAPLKQDY